MDKIRYKLCINDPSLPATSKFVIYEVKRYSANFDYLEFRFSTNVQEEVKIWLDCMGLKIGKLSGVEGFNNSLYELVER